MKLNLETISEHGVTDTFLNNLYSLQRILLKREIPV